MTGFEGFVHGKAVGKRPGGEIARIVSREKGQKNRFFAFPGEIFSIQFFTWCDVTIGYPPTGKKRDQTCKQGIRKT